MVFGRSSGYLSRLAGWVRQYDRAISGGFLFRGSQILFVVAGAAVVLLMVITFVGVVFRRSPLAGPWLQGGFEISELLMAMIAVLAIAYTWYIGGHIRIGLFRDRRTPRNKAVLDAVASFWGVVWVAAIVWSVWQVSMSSLTSGMGTGVLGIGTGILGIPIAPFQIIFSIVMAHFFLVLLRSWLGFSARAGGRHMEHEGLY